MAGDNSGHPTEWYSGSQTQYSFGYTPQDELRSMSRPLENVTDQLSFLPCSSNFNPICINTLPSSSPLGDAPICQHFLYSACLYTHTTTSSIITVHESRAPFLPKPSLSTPNDCNYLQFSKNLTCTICNRTFTRPQDLRRHLQTAKEHARQRTFLCEFCGRSYSRADALTRHKKTTKSCKSQS